MPRHLAATYKSGAQRTRVVSEAWAEKNLYCPNCTSPALWRAAPNTQAIDFTCPDCQSPFQLKSQSRPFSVRITDAAYESMVRAIVEGRTPNLLTLHYDSARWWVKDLVLVPRFVFSLSCLERRNPLSPTARRHHWVGCNILLTSIPPDARISMVANGVAASPATVRKEFTRLRPLEKLDYEKRGWTLDVLSVVRRLEKPHFSLGEVYAYTQHLQQLHPQNVHIHDKIRQQLQWLRDLGFLEFVGRGTYRLR